MSFTRLALTGFLLASTGISPVAAQVFVPTELVDSSPEPQPPLLSFGGTPSDPAFPLDLGPGTIGSEVNRYAKVLSDDGTVIGGGLFLPPDPATLNRGYQTRAAIWDKDGKVTELDMGGFPGAVSSRVTSVSGDGKVVVGVATVQPPAVMSSPEERGFVSIDGGTPMDLGSLLPDNSGRTFVNAVSRNGQSVIGETDAAFGSGGKSTSVRRAFLWTQSGGMQDLGALTSDSNSRSNAVAVSDDGNVVVGQSSILGPVEGCVGCGFPQQSQAVMWKDGNIIPLGSLIPTLDANSSPADVNADGSIAVGWSSGLAPGETLPPMPISGPVTTKTTQQAVLWRDGKIEGLGFLSTHPDSVSIADQVSRDGKVVIGWSTTDIQKTTPAFPKTYYNHAFRYTDDGGMKSLGALATDDKGNSYVNDMNEDGSIIVGISDTDGTLTYKGQFRTGTTPEPIQRGFVWTEKEGMQAVGTLRDVDNLGSSTVEAISADGTVVVGRSQTNETQIKKFEGFGVDERTTRLFILRLMQNTDANGNTTMQMGPMLDLQNTQTQIINTAQQQSRGVGGLVGGLTGALDAELEVGAADDPDTTVSTQGRAPLRMPIAVNVAGTRYTSGGGLTTNNLRAQASVGLTPYLTFGGFVQVGQQDQGIAGINFNGNLRTSGLYLRGGQQFGTGLTWKLSLGALRGEADITRVNGFANTELGVGRAKIEANAVKAELGYGYAIGATAMNSFVRFGRTTATRGAFTETAGATFPISYNAFDMEHTTLSVGTNARLKVSRKGALTLGLAIDKDLNSSSNPITGTSAIPGFTNFSVAGPTVVNDTRATISASYEHALSGGQSIVIGAYAGQARYDNNIASGVSIGYTARW